MIQVISTKATLRREVSEALTVNVAENLLYVSVRGHVRITTDMRAER